MNNNLPSMRSFVRHARVVLIGALAVLFLVVFASSHIADAKPLHCYASACYQDSFGNYYTPISGSAESLTQEELSTQYGSTVEDRYLVDARGERFDVPPNNNTACSSQIGRQCFAQLGQPSGFTGGTESGDTAQCSDGFDNDGDLLIDEDDPGCRSSDGSYDPEDNSELDFGSDILSRFRVFFDGDDSDEDSVCTPRCADRDTVLSCTDSDDDGERDEVDCGFGEVCRFGVCEDEDEARGGNNGRDDRRPIFEEF